MTRPGDGRSIIVVGGSGFIGSNLAASFLDDGEHVTVLDDLSRPGVEANLSWLKKRQGGRLTVRISDIRDSEAIAPVLADAKAVFHLAAQTAVTTSLMDPVQDFEVNAHGTLNVLEAVRATGRAVPVIFASTNKVYGPLADIRLAESGGLDLPVDAELRRHGVGESRPLDFSTPYGCSKGVADQYVLDYAKSFGLPTAVLRMSCIYGPRQFGTEDQGWLAHFLISAMAGRPITIFGDGRQVRDVLHVGDAVRAYRAVLSNIQRVSGRAFNLGGGPANAIDLNGAIKEIGRIVGREVVVHRSGMRTGDQRFFVADTRALEQALGWRPEIAWRNGLEDLSDWLARERNPGADRERFVA